MADNTDQSVVNKTDKPCSARQTNRGQHPSARQTIRVIEKRKRQGVVKAESGVESLRSEKGRRCLRDGTVVSSINDAVSETTDQSRASSEVGQADCRRECCQGMLRNETRGRDRG